MANTKEQESYRNQMRMLGNVWCQYQVLEKYQNAKLVTSQIHAGPGEIPFGRNPRQGVDLTVIEDWGVVTMKQFHGSYYHYSGHFSYCDRTDPNADLRDTRDGVYCSNHDNYPFNMTEGPNAFILNDTLSADKEKKICVEKLNAVKDEFIADGVDSDGFLPLTFKYDVEWECQMFHFKNQLIRYVSNRFFIK